MNYYQNSKCHRSWLHKFRILFNDERGYAEVCERCHVKLFFRKDPRGKINNRRYVSFHIREILQPFNKLFKKEHPHYGERKK